MSGQGFLSQHDPDGFHYAGSIGKDWGNCARCCFISWESKECTPPIDDSN